MITLKEIVSNIISGNGGVYILDNPEDSEIKFIQKKLQADLSVHMIIMSDERVMEIILDHALNSENESLSNAFGEYNTIFITDVDFLAGRPVIFSYIADFINIHPQKKFILSGIQINQRMSGLIKLFENLSGNYQSDGFSIQDITV